MMILILYAILIHLYPLLKLNSFILSSMIISSISLISPITILYNSIA